jgi:hypothetical protein
MCEHIMLRSIPIISVMALLGDLIVPALGYVVASIIRCSSCPRFQ